MYRIDNKSVKILIVDDTPENLEIAGSILARDQYDIYIADNGLSALELANNNLFDLILLDLMMPGLDGFETCIQIRKIPINRSVPIIFLTARAEIDSVIRGFEIGASDYIRKPFNPVELLARVKTHVEVRKFREQLELQNFELERALAYARSLARTDELTGLLNRREINALIEYEVVRAERSKHEFSIVIADIDFFKAINDVHGHLVGDNVLIEIARILSQSVRAQDFVSRWGGEELLLLLPETTPEEAVELANRLRLAVGSYPFSGDGKIFYATMSFGICGHTPGMTLNTLLDRADKALYVGKNTGRNKVVLSEA
ncbi:MAG: diguanylate cyclase [Eubacteriales bacterium]|nr:diguanylate cyclase [Eubacteriales bacterium]